jgi:hypothetical protein
MPNQIKPTQPKDTGALLYEITLDEPKDPFPRVGVDVQLAPVVGEGADPSAFGMQAMAADATLYELRTNNARATQLAISIPSQRKVVVRTANGALKSYSGWLQDCMSQAYNDGAFSPRA